jgi:DNA-binding MarR family transcriptional regulator
MAGDIGLAKAAASKADMKGSRPAGARRARRPKASLPPDKSVGYIVREVHRAMMRSLEARLVHHGISSGMWWFLRLLWIEDGVSQTELSDRLKVMGPTTVRAIERLGRFGLITREPDPKDGRKVIIRLTQKGRDLERELLPHAVEVNQIGTAGLSEDEGQTLRSLLGRVLDNLTKDQTPTN